MHSSHSCGTHTSWRSPNRTQAQMASSVASQGSPMAASATQPDVSAFLLNAPTDVAVAEEKVHYHPHEHAQQHSHYERYQQQQPPPLPYSQNVARPPPGSRLVSDGTQSDEVSRSSATRATSYDTPHLVAAVPPATVDVYGSSTDGVGSHNWRTPIDGALPRGTVEVSVAHSAPEAMHLTLPRVVASRSVNDSVLQYATTEDSPRAYMLPRCLPPAGTTAAVSWGESGVQCTLSHPSGATFTTTMTLTTDPRSTTSSSPFAPSLCGVGGGALSRPMLSSPESASTQALTSSGLSARLSHSSERPVNKAYQRFERSVQGRPIGRASSDPMEELREAAMLAAASAMSD